ncbi:hypothetical protein Tco_1340489, partial [Tanacetum coccineum]
SPSANHFDTGKDSAIADGQNLRDIFLLRIGNKKGPCSLFSLGMEAEHVGLSNIEGQDENRSNNTNAFRTFIVAFPWDLSKNNQTMHIDAVGAKSKKGSHIIVATSPPMKDDAMEV